jgi:hypothetical protein
MKCQILISFNAQFCYTYQSTGKKKCRLHFDHLDFDREVYQCELDRETLDDCSRGFLLCINSSSRIKLIHLAMYQLHNHLIMRVTKQCSSVRGQTSGHNTIEEKQAISLSCLIFYSILNICSVHLAFQICVICGIKST